jgi:hypothetical protein
MTFHQTKVCAEGWGFSDTISHGNDLRQYSTNDQSFPQNLAPFDLAPQNGPEPFEHAGPGPGAAGNNNQVIPPDFI